jgi:hypothetical protein
MDGNVVVKCKYEMRAGRRLPCPTSASGCRDGGRQGRRDVGTWAHGRLDAGGRNPLDTI